jgi:quercetin dioxygenase-like cupin family protein
MTIGPFARAGFALCLLAPLTAAAKVETVTALAPPSAPGACLSLKTVTYEPGEGSPSHSHDATVVAYVLGGAVDSQVDDEPLRTYRTGDHWQEAPGARHAVSRNASATQPATFLVVMLADRGSREAEPCTR